MSPLHLALASNAHAYRLYVVKEQSLCFRIAPLTFNQRSLAL
jgi:hypothetical protein